MATNSYESVSRIFGLSGPRENQELEARERARTTFGRLYDTGAGAGSPGIGIDLIAEPGVSAAVANVGTRTEGLGTREAADLPINNPPKPGSDEPFPVGAEGKSAYSASGGNPTERMNPFPTGTVGRSGEVLDAGKASNSPTGDEKPNGYNPFLKKDGSLFNPYIDYQKVLDNPGVSSAAKKYISEATGLAQTPVAAAGSETAAVSGPYSGQLGFISAKYESGGWNPGSVSSGGGDYGGVSYGIPQFSTTTGSAASFVKWLKQKAPEIGNYFGSAQPGTSEFNSAWKQAAAKYGNTFGKYQTEYAYQTMVQPLIKLAKEKTGVDYSRSAALQELVYSTAIQFGGGSLGLSALGNVSAGMSDADLINASYDKKIANYKSFFKSSSSDVQESVRNRFQNERKDVLGLLGRSGNSSGSSGGGSFSGKVGSRIANPDNYKNDAAYGQCVWYVRGRMKEKLGKDTGALGNANEMWYNAPERARLSASADNIKPNTVASYKIGSSGSKYGHVIYIEAVDGDNVYFTEGGSGYHKSGTDGTLKRTTKRDLLNGSGGFGSGLIGLIDINKL